MAETIRDGTGTGNQARVNPYNQLLVLGVTMPIEMFLSNVRQSVYAFGIDEAQIPTTGVEYPVIWFKNTSPDTDLHVMSMFGSYNGGDTNHNRVAYVKHRVNTSAPTGGYVSVPVYPVNLGHGATADIDLRVWDQITPGGMVVTGSGTGAGTVMMAQGFTDFHAGGGDAVGVGQSMLITARVEESGTVCIGSYILFDGDLIS